VVSEFVITKGKGMHNLQNHHPYYVITNMPPLKHYTGLRSVIDPRV